MGVHEKKKVKQAVQDITFQAGRRAVADSRLSDSSFGVGTIQSQAKIRDTVKAFARKIICRCRYVVREKEGPREVLSPSLVGA